ncbi:MAG: hypothetical protein J2O49_02200 [Sciscionella sp.]|nr:hypothetical protein [Sciscionella sp.]
MADKRRVLVLHFHGSDSPLLIAVARQSWEALAARLPDMLRAGKVESLPAENGSHIAVNFARVVAAHIDTTKPLAEIYGAAKADDFGVAKT